MKEERVILTESLFTGIAKNGFFRYYDNNQPHEFQFNRNDIVSLTKGDIIEKETYNFVIKFALADIGMDHIKEIIKRSPIYSELINTI